MSGTRIPRRTRASRIGGMIGNWLSTGVSIYVGYMWAKHGLLRAAEIEGGFLITMFGLYGALRYPWGSAGDA